MAIEKERVKKPKSPSNPPFVWCLLRFSWPKANMAELRLRKGRHYKVDGKVDRTRMCWRIGAIIIICNIFSFYKSYNTKKNCFYSVLNCSCFYFSIRILQFIFSFLFHGYHSVPFNLATAAYNHCTTPWGHSSTWFVGRMILFLLGRLLSLQ